MGGYLKERERYMMETFLREGCGVSYIAARLGRCRATIYNEIKRGKVEYMDSDLQIGERYDAYAGERIKEERSHHKGIGLKVGGDMQYIRKVEDLILKHKYSPYACVVHIARHCPEIRTRVCTATLYSYIHKGLFLNVKSSDLPYHKTPKGKPRTAPRMPLNHRGGKIIDERPKAVSSRDVVGDWEMDTVVGGQGKSRDCLLVLTERKSRLEIIRRMPDKRAAATVSVLDSLEYQLGRDGFRSLFRTVTSDNGCEFLDGGGIQKSLDGSFRTQMYYCHPYRSNERATNENQNRFIRRWVPKGSDISRYSDQQIHSMQTWINNYPRRMFGGLSAREVFEWEYLDSS